MKALEQPIVPVMGRDWVLKLYPSVQGHKNSLLGIDSGEGKWPICLASNAKCSVKTAREYSHVKHAYGMQTIRSLNARTIDHSVQDELAADCTVKPT